jgi:limonene-1,2-epoxide hydrolase
MSATNDVASPLAVVERLRDAINAHDLDALVECFAPDFQGETPTTPDQSFVGNENVRRNWSKIFAGVPDLTFDIVRSTTEGNTVWAEVEQRGKALNGTPHLARGVIVFEIVGDQMKHNRLYVNPVRSGEAEVMAQAAARA